MTSISVCDDWSEEIRVCNAATIRFRRGYSLFTLFPVVEELSQEQLAHFVWDSILYWLSTGSLNGGYGGFIP